MAQSNETILIALTGLPSSGKSFFAEKLALELDRSRGLRVMVISSDNVRAEMPVLKGRFIPDVENAMRRLSLARARSALREGFPVIFDDLNYYRSMRRQLFTLARDLRIPHFLVHLATREKECLALNAARGRKIPDTVITTDAIRFDPPGEEPWDAAFLTLSAMESTDAAIVRAADKITRRAGSAVPPLEDSGTGTLERSRTEEIDLLSRRVIGDLYRQRGPSAHPKALRAKRISLVKDAVRRSLNDSAAEALFQENLKDDFPPNAPNAPNATGS
jgi:tRNA uridine 5-carbamoylmethylation protein Kti12